MWANREWKAFCEMLPEYASKGHGEGFMHDTAMLMGALGWTGYDGGRGHGHTLTLAPAARASSTPFLR